MHNTLSQGGKLRPPAVGANFPKQSVRMRSKVLALPHASHSGETALAACHACSSASLFRACCSCCRHSYQKQPVSAPLLQTILQYESKTFIRRKENARLEIVGKSCTLMHKCLPQPCTSHTARLPNSLWSLAFSRKLRLPKRAHADTTTPTRQLNSIQYLVIHVQSKHGCHAGHKEHSTLVSEGAG